MSDDEYVEMTWRYACVQRTYVTLIDDMSPEHEVHYELCEAFNGEDDPAYTAEPVGISCEKSKDELVLWLLKAAQDLMMSDLIIDPDPVIRDLRSTDEESDKNEETDDV